MKRFIFIAALLLSGLWAAAQDGKVVTPHTVNPSETQEGSSAVVSNLVDGLNGAPMRGKWYIGLGGGIDYSSAYGWDITIAPDFSYKVSNSLFVGTQFSYSYFQKESLAGITPYLRWHVVPLGKAVSLYATAYAPIQFWKDYMEIGVRVRPGLAVRLSDGFYVMASYGSLGYSYFNISGVTGSGRVSNWGSDTIHIGFLFNL